MRQLAVLWSIGKHRSHLRAGVSDRKSIRSSTPFEIALRADGCLALVSGDAWLADYPGNHREQRTVSDWQGVGAYVELRRSRLQGINLVSIMQGLPGYAPVMGLKFE